MNNALTVLKQTFGFLEFRPPQDEIISCLISGGDAMVIMPTGGGKSLCYQIPAIVRPGCGVVISPLIALMQNQVDALHELGVRANFLNSTLDRDESLAIEQALLEGELDLLYIAPERLVQPQMLALLKRAQISLFAIDEAHCVSQWGHDFRVDYLQLSLLHREFPGIPRIALTATADSRTREEIIQRLNLGAAGHFFAGFDRPNIRYTITLKQNTRVQLLRFLNDAHRNDAGIIYCLSRKKTEETAVWLQGQGFSALPYHAGLSAERRALNQTRFLREESVIIVATIAFGMGIDKPDVRFVAHLDLPKTIESYYQETGRAGRDGLPADAWMIYGLQDVIKLRQMMEGSDGSAEFKRLEQHRLNAMLGLCEITSCRRHDLLAYFDEVSSERCENCDTCLSPVSTWDATDACRRALSVVFRTGQRFGVNHVIDVLRGTATPKVSQFDHQLLPVFGLGKELVAEQWRSVFRQLVARGFLSVNVDAFGALQLEEKSRPLLRGEITLELRRDLKTTAAKQQTRTPISNDIDVELWEALRECRRVLAETQRVPPYVIFSNNTLQAMAEQRPQTIEAFSQLSGVGERKRDKYVPAFLEVLRYAQG